MDQMSSVEETLLTAEEVATAVAEKESPEGEQRLMNVKKLMMAAHPDAELSMAEEQQLLRERDRLLTAVRKGHELSADEEKLIATAQKMLNAREELATGLDQLRFAIEKSKAENLKLLRTTRQRLLTDKDELSRVREEMICRSQQIRRELELVMTAGERSPGGVKFLAEKLQRLSTLEQQICLQTMRIERCQARVELQLIATEQLLTMGRYMEDHLNRIMLLDFNETRSNTVEEHLLRSEKLQAEIEKLEAAGEHLEMRGQQPVMDEMDAEYEHLQKVSELLHSSRAQHEGDV